MYYKNNIVNHQNILPVEFNVPTFHESYSNLLFLLKKKLVGVNHSGAINNNSIYLNTIKNSPKLMWSYKNNKIHFSDFLKVSMS